MNAGVKLRVRCAACRLNYSLRRCVPASRFSLFSICLSAQIKDYYRTIAPTRARFVRVKAVNFGKIPVRDSMRLSLWVRFSCSKTGCFDLAVLFPLKFF